MSIECSELWGKGRTKRSYVLVERKSSMDDVGEVSCVGKRSGGQAGRFLLKYVCVGFYRLRQASITF